jgi:hypothetical protein
MPKSIAFLLSSGLIAGGLLVVLPSAGVHAQAASASQMTPQQVQAFREAQAPTQLTMPLVGPEQGREFQQARVVPTSDVPKPISVHASAVPDSRFAGVQVGNVGAAPVAPSLGHPLPTSAISPLGYPRADFAIDKTQSSSRLAKPAGVSTSSATSSAVIQ